MYEQQYGLNRRPFSAVATGTDVFVGPQTAKMMQALKKALVSSEAAVAVLGPTGVGKTTLVNRALEAIDGNKRVIRIGRMQLGHDEVLEFLLDEFNAEDIPASTIRKISLLKKLIAEQAARGLRVFIVIEDAVRIGIDALAEFEALTAAEGGGGDGANLILMGDSSLKPLLGQESLTRLQQRVRLYHDVHPLVAAEFLGYFKHSFRLAGAEFDLVFDKGAAEYIHALTEGIPRIANNLVESVLNAGTEQQLARIDLKLIGRVAEDEYGLMAEMPVVETRAAEPTPRPVPEPVTTAPDPQPEPLPDPAAEQEPLPNAERAPVPVAATVEPMPEPAPLPEPVTTTPEQRPELELEPVPIVATPELEPEPEPVDATPAPLPELEPEPAPVATTPELEPEPEPAAATPAPLPELDAKPEPVAATPAPLPELEPEPEPVAAAPEPGLSAPVASPAADKPANPHPDIPELIDDTLPDLAVLAPNLATAAAEPAVQAKEPELVAPDADTEIPTLDSSSGIDTPETEDIPDFDRDPTLAQLRPDIEALEDAMAGLAEPEPIPTAEPTATEESDAGVDATAPVNMDEDAELKDPTIPSLPKITLDDKIEEKVKEATASLDMDETTADEGGVTSLEEKEAEQHLKSTTELRHIATGLSKAKTLEDVDDELAETLFGSGISAIAAEVIARGPDFLAEEESANQDHSVPTEEAIELELEATYQGPAQVAASEVPETTAETPDEQKSELEKEFMQTYGEDALEVSLETDTPKAGLDLSASQRLATVRALNADQLPPGALPPKPAGNGAEEASQPASIEDQIKTSITQTFAALNVRPEALNDDDDDDEEDEPRKRGFFSRFRRS